MSRVRDWAEARDHRIRGYNPWLITVRVLQRFTEVRVTGLGAEMAYYALVSTIPLVATLGAAMGTFERILGPEGVQQLEDVLVSSLERVFSAELTVTVMEPLVRGLLAEERAGFAIGGLLITFWFAGGAFRAAIRALDDAYKVPERRSTLSQWAVAYGLTVGAVVGLVVLLSLVVVGPLLGGGHQIATWLRLGTAFEVAWATLRWVVVAVGGGAYLVWLYRIAPNVKNGWRDCVPGAVLAGTGTLLITLAFRVYLEVAGPAAPAVGDAGAAVQVVSQTIGAILAAVLWVWLVSCAVLTGGILNAELDHSRGIRRERKV
jgi:membrane protein